MTAPAARLLLGLSLCGLMACRQELAVEVIPRGQQEVVLLASEPAPLFVGGKTRAGLCFEIPAGQEASRWRGRVLFDGTAGAWQEPALRQGTLICFGEPLPEKLAAAASRRSFELCVEIRDELAETTWSLPCVHSFYEPDVSPGLEIEARQRELLALAFDRPTREIVADLGRLAADAERRQLPLTAQRIRLIALHFLLREGGPGPLAEAALQLEALPPWLESPVAGYFGALAEHHAGRFAIETGAEQAGWQRISRADNRLGALGYPRLSTAVDLARLLGRLGDLSGARARIEGALVACDTSHNCNADLVLLAKSDLAWLILQDGTAGPVDLDHAESLLREVLAAPATDPLNHANTNLNLAYLLLLRDQDARPPLTRADEMLRAEAPSARRAYYLRWQTLLSGLLALETGDPLAAGRICRGLATQGEPEVSAWAWGCAGRAERARGRPAAALAEFEKALDGHEIAATRSRREEAMPLGLDQRADAFAQAARAAIEAGDPRRAWNILLRLDRLAASEVGRRRCRDAARDPQLRREWQQLDGDIAAALIRLRELEEPAPGREQEARRQSAAELKAQLQNLWRQWPGCRPELAAPPASEAEGLLTHLAFALDDEVVLLGRDPRGVQVLKRSAFQQNELVALMLELERGKPGAVPQERWRELASPLAAALLPPVHPEAGSGLLVYGLHGILQAAPLAALPLPDRDSPPFGGLVPVAVSPAGADARKPSLAPVHGEESRVTFVLDPGENLAGALEWNAEMAGFYPRAHVLRGPAATRAALLAALPRSSLLHLDAHATYDAAFPELSALELADAPLRWLELEGLDVRLELANLSGCQTGLGPITADRGSHGLGGAFVRLGVPLVIASRRPLPDQVAADFNRLFYRQLGAGHSVPEAWRRSLAELATCHPASAWSGLMLLKGN